MNVERSGDLVHIPDDRHIRQALNWRHWNDEQTQQILDLISANISRDLNEELVIGAANALEMVRCNALERVTWDCLNEANRLDLIGLNPDGTPIADGRVEAEVPNACVEAGRDIVAALRAAQEPYGHAFGDPAIWLDAEYMASLWWAGRLRGQIERALDYVGRTDLLEGDKTGEFQPTILLTVKWARRLVAMQFGESERSIIRRSKGMTAAQILSLEPLAA